MRWLLSCFRKEQDKRLERILRKGSDKIEKMLDIRTIVKHQRTLETLKRLLVPKQTRKLIHMQRRTRVLEESTPESGSSDCSLGDEKEIDLLQRKNEASHNGQFNHATP